MLSSLLTLRLDLKGLSLSLIQTVNFWDLFFIWFASYAFRALLLCQGGARMEGVKVHIQPVQPDGIHKKGFFSRPQETEGGFGQVEAVK